jgi:hypothetical protein
MSAGRSFSEPKRANLLLGEAIVHDEQVTLLPDNGPSPSVTCGPYHKSGEAFNQATVGRVYVKRLASVDSRRIGDVEDTWILDRGCRQ